MLMPLSSKHSNAYFITKQNNAWYCIVILQIIYHSGLSGVEVINSMFCSLYNDLHRGFCCSWRDAFPRNSWQCESALHIMYKVKSPYCFRCLLQLVQLASSPLELQLAFSPCSSFCFSGQWDRKLPNTKVCDCKQDSKVKIKVGNIVDNFVKNVVIHL